MRVKGGERPRKREWEKTAQEQRDGDTEEKKCDTARVGRGW